MAGVRSTLMAGRQWLVVGGLVMASLATMAVAPSAALAEPMPQLGSFGTPNGAGGGQLVSARGVAANRSGNGAPVGSVYVAEANPNQRISQFAASGRFIRTWGFDVVASGPGNNGTGFEICEPANGDVCKAGVVGAAAGQLALPLGIAIDQANGYLYVPSGTNRRVDVFSGTGQFAGAFGWGVDTGAPALEVCTTVSTCQVAGAAGADAGRFGALPSSVPAVDPNVAGRVYVPEPGNRRISQFSSTIAGGVLSAVAFDKAFGWGVDTGAAALQSCTTASTCQAGSAGNGVGQFGTGSPTTAAVDGAGAIYATAGPVAGDCAPATPCRILKFAPDASSASEFGPASGPGQLLFTTGTAQTVSAASVAIDPADDHVFVQRRESTDSYRVLEYDSAGNYIESHPSSLLTTTAVNNNNNPGLAVGASGVVYSNLSAGGAGEVLLLGEVEPEPAVAPVTDIGSTTATFNGVVTVPSPGWKTIYHFEYSNNGVDWIAFPDPPASVGDVDGAHVIARAVAGLDPSTIYQVRLVAEIGESRVYSSTTSFTTGSVAPRIAEAFVDGATDTTARLGAYLDPEGLASTYRFEWGGAPCSANPCASVPAFERALGGGNEAVLVSEPLAGLAPATTYHYRVVATNDAGVAEGPDRTFGTLNSCGLVARCHELAVPPGASPE